MLTTFLRRRTLPALLLFLLLSSLPLLSQTFRGTINGTVTDPSGAVVSGAKVTATDTATKVTHNTVSSGAGEFSFNDLPASTYVVDVQAAGFQNTEVNGVQLLAGKSYTLPVKMTVAQQASTVEVSADALSLDTTTVTQTTALDAKHRSSDASPMLTVRKPTRAPDFDMRDRSQPAPGRW